MSKVTHYLLSQPNQPPKDVRRMMMMTMIGETLLRPNPTTVQIQIPPWDPLDDNNGPPSPPVVHSPYSNNASGSILDSLTALHRYLPSNDPTAEEELVLDAFSCDHFRMYEFKVRRCARGRSHDWTECPYAHPGEKARRRDPRRYHYSGTACPDFRKGAGCKKGDSCEFAHGVFECWLHPARYRTQPCKDGSNCRRRVCFFAHTPGQLRVLPHGGIGSGSGSCEIEFGSPRMRHLDSYMTMPGAGVGSGSFLSSPTSILASPPVSPPSDSPPMSPSSPQVASELVASMRGLQLGKMRMGPGAWGMQAGTKLGSPLGGSSLRPGPNSLPSTPTRARGTLSGLGLSDIWDLAICEEEPAMERVESGRDIRAKMYAKLSKENSLERGAVEGGVAAPDVGWISELVK